MYVIKEVFYLGVFTSQKTLSSSGNRFVFYLCIIENYYDSVVII